MIRKVFVGLIVGVVIFGAGQCIFAQSGEADTQAAVTNTTNAEDAGNKICPVSGEKIEETMKATYEYNGKVYNFCCASCIEEFKKDPDKYIKKVNEELQPQVKQEEGQNNMMPETEMPTSGHGNMQH